MIDWNFLLIFGTFGLVVVTCSYCLIRLLPIKTNCTFRTRLRLEAETDMEGVKIIYDDRVASVPLVAVTREFLYTKGKVLDTLAEIESKFGPFEDQDGIKGQLSYFDDMIYFKPDAWKGFKPVRVSND